MIKNLKSGLGEYWKGEYISKDDRFDPPCKYILMSLGELEILVCDDLEWYIQGAGFEMNGQIEYQEGWQNVFTILDALKDGR